MTLACDLDRIKADLERLAGSSKTDPSRFFKTKPGDYGAHDRFLGVPVGSLRRLAKAYKTLPLKDIHHLLQGIYNEERFLGLLLLIQRFDKANEEDRRHLYAFYVDNRRYINNWNLVDVSAHLIVGQYLFHPPSTLVQAMETLRSFAHAPDLWTKRIGIVATLFFIRQGVFDPTLTLAEILINDRHDLIHKAVGWMLREVGKRDETTLRRFLNDHGPAMPRTMLRYAIERFPAPERQFYLSHVFS